MKVSSLHPKGKKMLEQSFRTEKAVNMEKGIHFPDRKTPSTRLLLSALGHGWKMVRLELAPTWDQTGLIYLVTLQDQTLRRSRRIILPKNPTVENLLHSYPLPPVHQKFQAECGY
jgi:hypothetical protein